MINAGQFKLIFMGKKSVYEYDFPLKPDSLKVVTIKLKKRGIGATNCLFRKSTSSEALPSGWAGAHASGDCPTPEEMLIPIPCWSHRLPVLEKHKLCKRGNLTGCGVKGDNGKVSCFKCLRVAAKLGDKRSYAVSDCFDRISSH